MKILLVYPNTQKQKSPQIGLCMISATAKKLGHEVELFDLTFIKEGTEVEEFKNIIKRFCPEIIGVSTRSNDFSMVKKLMEHVPSKHIITIAGGSHATVSPMEVIKYFDIVVMGEGEKTFAELLFRFKNGILYYDTKGTWTKTENQITKNPMRKLVEDLDTLPTPDWKLFDDRHYTDSYVKDSLPNKLNIIGTFEMSRGCPFNCSYCTNDYVRNLYDNPTNWRREKSMPYIIDEIKQFREIYGLDAVYFIDEIILNRMSWIKLFHRVYKYHIDVPFIFMERPENMANEEKVELIAEAGAIAISIGIESGDEYLRKNLLNRKYSDDIVIKAFENARKYKIKTHAFNMIGFPFELMKKENILYEHNYLYEEMETESMEKSLKLIKKAKPDTVQTTIFYPLKNTELYNKMVERKLIDPNMIMPISYYNTTDEKLFKYQFLLSYYYLPKIFFKFYKYSRDKKILLRISNWLFRAINRNRKWGMKSVFGMMWNTIKRKFKKGN